MPPQRKQPWFVRVALVNRKEVLKNRTVAALSTAGWPDKIVRAIHSKQPDRFKASTAALSRHLKRQEGRGRLDSKFYSVARIWVLTCHELDTPKLHMRCKLLVLFFQHVYCANIFTCMKDSDDMLLLSKCATNTAICHLLYAPGLFRTHFFCVPGPWNTKMLHIVSHATIKNY